MTLFLLFAAHFLCDYPLQGDFLARGKNHKAPLPGIPWYQCLFAHAFVHAGAVALITGSVYLGICELIVHCAIDWSKCNGNFGEGHAAFNIDQTLHLFCKTLWLFLPVLLK